ncbi:MAG: shikimate kinase [Treponema sp.]|jgi:shikimate kinase|nr:shikimate kinase [Treponema sp.]
MKNICLIGPKHSGKTTVGRVLASLCSGCFVDLDELLAERTGKSPRTLYTQGTAVFRKAEAEALAAFIGSKSPGPRIAAVGGGLTDNPEAVALLEKTETILSVYLNVSADTAWDRIIGSGGDMPPFLRTDNPRETHRILHERRAAACRKFARFTIEAEGKNPKAIAGEIMDMLTDIRGAP